MDAKALAEILNGCDVDADLSEEIELATKHQLAIAFVESNAVPDVLVLHGIVSDSIKLYSSDSFFVTQSRRVEMVDQVEEDLTVFKRYDAEMPPMILLEVEDSIMSDNDYAFLGPAWTVTAKYQGEQIGEPFELIESKAVELIGDRSFCRGVVFSLPWLSTAQPACSDDFCPVAK